MHALIKLLYTFGYVYTCHHLSQSFQSVLQLPTYYGLMKYVKSQIIGILIKRLQIFMSTFVITV